ncbi:hypothetical protein L6164_009399 [Bauhinia variegata]|uniref:Uncharacterized protein n=1 Tax=Bauhinia variegata TaxID=167791 RepID=A0ACB9PQ55_BAUVA|nr:hypothetical protein L6164_009399 [Bauhinia variegata]
MDEKSLVSWSALLAAFVKNDYAKEALVLFLDILEIGVNLHSGCFSTVLDGCSESNDLEVGLQIHGLAIKLGHASDVNTGTALIDLYAKCVSFQSARVIFDSLRSKTIASFNAILAGYLNSNIEDVEKDPMVFFSKLRFNGVEPDRITFSRLFSLSADRACLGTGKNLHPYSTKMGLENDFAVRNAVITMYAKCGSIEDAHQIFSSMNSHDCVTWNAIISACALHGNGNKALCFFEVMKKEGFAPDEITILAVLKACSYSGLWENGLRLFNDMKPKYGIWPKLVPAGFISTTSVAGDKHHPESREIYANLDLLRDEINWRDKTRNNLQLHSDSF